MRTGPTHRVKRGPDGEPAVDQGLVHGWPCSYNPDDGKFYIHDKGTADGTNVLGGFADWRNAVQYARQRGLQERLDASAEGPPLEHGELTRIIIGTVVASERINARQLAEKLNSEGIGVTAAQMATRLHELARAGRIERLERGFYTGV